VNVSAVLAQTPDRPRLLPLRAGLTTQQNVPDSKTHTQQGGTTYRRHNLIEVRNLLPQSSQDHEWSIRPPTPKQDSSATSNMLPHCGQFGRLNFTFADVSGTRPSYAGWTIIVDSPRRPSPHSHLISNVQVICGVAATRS
jgi:hypothetical protein